MRELVDLVLAWWRRDTIRVRPSEGRMLRLRPGAVLCFSLKASATRTSVEVVSRTVDRAEGASRVTYVCQTGCGSGELIVTLEHDQAPHVIWSTEEVSFELHVDDIEVFQGS